MNQSIHDKVRAILDRANHPNTPQAEAETALALAQKLIIKHGIDEALLVVTDKPEEIVKDELVIAGRYDVRRLTLAFTIAKANSVASYRSERLHEGKWVKVLVLYGTNADIFAVKTLFASADLLASRLIPKHGDRSLKTSWWHGFTTGIRQVLSTAKNDVIKDSGAQGSNVALVLRSKYERADKEMRAKVKIRTTSSSSSIRNSSAYYSGVKSGASFSLGSTRIGGGTIGALNR
jgi:hypothetical protein